MPDLIQREVLTKEKLALFHDFDCGESADQPWVQAVNDWITGRSADDCAALDIKNRRCKVFLYRNQAGDLIGFGSLGKTKAQWPMPDGPKIPVAIIPWIGLDKRYHGQPKGQDADGNEEIRYSDQIVADLVYEAKNYNVEALFLFVDPRNTGAIRLYSRNGFASSNAPLEAGELMRMAVSLA